MLSPAVETPWRSTGSSAGGLRSMFPISIYPSSSSMMKSSTKSETWVLILALRFYYYLPKYSLGYSFLRSTRVGECWPVRSNKSSLRSLCRSSRIINKPGRTWRRRWSKRLWPLALWSLVNHLGSRVGPVPLFPINSNTHPLTPFERLLLYHSKVSEVPNSQGPKYLGTRIRDLKQQELMRICPWSLARQLNKIVRPSLVCQGRSEYDKLSFFICLNNT